MSRPARGGWIEIKYDALICDGAVSRPARGGWIEMAGAKRMAWAMRRPAPHGGVDAYLR